MLEEKIYKHKDLKITYYEAGKGSTVLFIHGVGIRALTYKNTLNELAAKYHVYAPDLPGFGKSDIPPLAWNFANYSEILNRFLIDLGERDVILIAHSLGGRIAIELTGFSTHVSRLILIDSSPLSTYYKYGRFHLARLILNTSLEIFLERNPNYAKVVFDNIFNLKKHRFSYIKFKKTIDSALKSESMTANKITIPTLILWGDKDRIVLPKYAYQLQQEIRKSEVRFIKGNHAWCITKPKILSQEIQRFLALSP